MGKSEEDEKSASKAGEDDSEEFIPKTKRKGKDVSGTSKGFVASLCDW